MLGVLLNLGNLFVALGLRAAGMMLLALVRALALRLRRLRAVTVGLVTVGPMTPPLGRRAATLSVSVSTDLHSCFDPDS